MTVNTSPHPDDVRRPSARASSCRRLRPTAFHSSITVLVAVLAVALFPGCAVWDFVDTRYQNAVGYFNTYYNAKTLFDEAVEEIRIAQRDRAAQRTEEPLPEAPPPAPIEIGAADASGGMMTPPKTKGLAPHMREAGIPSSALMKLDKVIEKCSRILVHYPKSKWVDNALLLIGRAYYYRGENGRAETKFRELLEGFPDGSLFGEGLLWLGRNAIQLERYDLAERYLTDAVAWGIEEREPALVADAQYTLGELMLLQEKPDRAIVEFRKGADVATDDDQRVQIALALAREEEKRGDKKAASDAYREIMRINPSRELAFNAELNYARLSRELGNIDEAAATLVSMLDNPTYIEFDPQIQLEIGHLYAAVKELKPAIDQYTYVDTTFRNQAVAAEASYAKGRIYELEAMDYDRAFEAYTAAKLAYPGAPGAKAGGRRSDDLGEYRKHRNRMFDVDTLLYFVLHPDSLTRRDSMQAITDSLDRIARAREGSRGPQTEEERMAERLARRRPHGRNTGRINPFVAMAAAAQEAPVAGGGITAPAGGTAAAPANAPLYRKLNLRTLKPDSLLSVLSEMRMEMGWIMFDRIGNLDSAAYYYDLALQGTLHDSLRANALYTAAAVARRRGDSVRAVEYEDRILAEAPNTRYATSIFLARGLPLPVDTAAIARSAYARAAELLERGRYQEGLEALAGMAAAYPHSDQSVRAKLAIAMTYERLDRGEEALDVYRSMVREHPNSPFSRRGREILDAIERAKQPKPSPEDEEQKRREEELRLARQREEEEEKARAARTRPTRLGEEELRAEREAARRQREAEKKDPTKDADFPLNLPGQKPVTPPPSPKPETPAPQPLPGGDALLPDSVPMTPGTTPPPPARTDTSTTPKTR